jgi:hypothetical protein
VFWLAPAIEYIDIDWDVLIYEIINLCKALPGTFGYDELKNMDYAEYMKVYKIAKDILSEGNNGN